MIFETIGDDGVDICVRDVCETFVVSELDVAGLIEPPVERPACHLEPASCEFFCAEVLKYEIFESHVQK
jgi:hypothetical protein